MGVASEVVDPRPTTNFLLNVALNKELFPTLVGPIKQA
jgi:hypothetical protein